ncbi:hypothetical protein E2C01_091558 [Portunus trituberculatus]|uniref:Uncharacterized protein n=1 Tax=Portunus trituberculatus TaxID=210409 RepID=A0A5B7JT70_PORTR|nr:hypothetical protein [Portunus trituberculatus]
MILSLPTPLFTCPPPPSSFLLLPPGVGGMRGEEGEEGEEAMHEKPFRILNYIFWRSRASDARREVGKGGVGEAGKDSGVSQGGGKRSVLTQPFSQTSLAR